MSSLNREVSASAATLVDLLDGHVAARPDHLATVFLKDGEQEERRLSYADLRRRALAIGARLQAEGLPGDRVLLLFPQGLDYVTAFWGCLYGGVVAVPVPDPARLSRSLPRLQAIVRDADVATVLTTDALLAEAGPLLAGLPDLARLRWLSVEQIQGEEAAAWRRPAPLRGEALAMFQYTSGSTGAPRGVMLSHHNLLGNQRIMAHGFAHGPDLVLIGWAPLFHDMGLVGNLLQSAYVGGTCVLMSPLAFLQRPARWLRAVSSWGGTTSGGPNFSFDLCVRKVSEEELEGVDLTRWSVAFNGGEPVRPATLDRFADRFGPVGFRRRAFCAVYGLAESACVVTVVARDAEPTVVEAEAAALERGALQPASGAPARTLAGCGFTAAGHRVEIVQPETGRRAAPGEVGEIWVAGDSVGQGYWARPEESAVHFGARLADTGEGPFLRTGDLGALLPSGELVVAGRSKDLIILSGRNLYPQDLEATVETLHPALRRGCVAAVSAELDGEERLVIVAEVDPARAQDPRPVMSAILRGVVLEHGVAVHAIRLLPPGGLPKTSSGKVQRSAAKAGFLQDSLPLLPGGAGPGGRGPA